MSPPDWNAVHADMRPRLRSVARSVLRDEHEAEDAVQDTFLRALRGIDRLRNPLALRGWLLTLAHRAAIDRGRRLRRTPQVADDVEELPDRRLLPACSAIEAAEAFARLSPRLQRVLEAWACGRSIKRIAEQEGVSIAAIRTRLCRARARFRALVQP